MLSLPWWTVFIRGHLESIWFPRLQWCSFNSTKIYFNIAEAKVTFTLNISLARSSILTMFFSWQTFSSDCYWNSIQSCNTLVGKSTKSKVKQLKRKASFEMRMNCNCNKIYSDETFCLFVGRDKICCEGKVDSHHMLT